jgi:predicted NBD/HSP70 family sugar kinase
VKAPDRPHRQASLREHNLALVLRQLAAAGARAAAASRADVAAVTGLTRATVSSLVDELVRGGLVEELGPATPGGVGRPATGLRLAGTGPAGLGLEVNVDYLAAVVVDLTGAVRHRSMHRADQRGRAPGAVADSLCALADRAAAAGAAQGLAVAGVAVAVPGLVQENVVRLAPNLDWHNVTLPPPLPGLPVTVENEANLAALGEAHAQSTMDFLYVSGEIGVGAGIVLRGELLRGDHGWAGELGHVTVHPDGPPCHCGSRGCLEQYAGQEAIAAAAGVPGPVTASQLAARARAGDAPTLDALAQAGTALGVAVAGVVNLLDVPTVVLGGGYALLEQWLAGPVRDQVARRVLTAAWSPVTVRASALGTEAAVVGAAGSIVEGIRADPAAWLASR